MTTYEDVLEYENYSPSSPMSMMKQIAIDKMNSSDNRVPLCDIDMTSEEENCILCLLEEYGLDDPLWGETVRSILNKNLQKLRELNDTTSSELVDSSFYIL